MATATDLEHIFTGSAAGLALNSTEQAVLAVIAANRNDKGICELTRKEIGDLCNSGQRTVSRAVAVLTAKNVVSREKGRLQKHQDGWHKEKSALRIHSATLEANKPKPKKTQAELMKEIINAQIEGNRQVAIKADAELARMRRAEKAARKAAQKKNRQ